MTREEVIEEVCTVVALIYRSVNDYSRASDGFCRRCLELQTAQWQFQHSGQTIDILRKAAVAWLKAQGYDIAEGFDPDTGEEIQPTRKADTHGTAR